MGQATAQSAVPPRSADPGRILAAIDDLAELSRGDVRRLEGGAEEAFRLRVGGWRIIFSYPDDTILLVHRVRPRGDVYKR